MCHETHNGVTHTEAIGDNSAVVRCTIDVVGAESMSAKSRLIAAAEKYWQQMLQRIKAWEPCKDFNKSLCVSHEGVGQANVRVIYRTNNATA